MNPSPGSFKILKTNKELILEGSPRTKPAFK